MTLSNVYLFTGQEKYLLDKELQRRKENFLLKFGLDSIFQFSVDALDMGLVKQAIYSSGLFTTKKLILITGFPLDATTKLGEDKVEQLDTFTDGFIKAEGKIPEDSLLVFVSSVPDKRLRLYKFLEKNAIVKEFNQLKNNDLEAFVKHELSEWTLSPFVVKYLLAKVGTDLYRLWFECDKLRTRAKVKQLQTIDETVVDTVVFGLVETDSFALLKTLFTDKLQAIALVQKIQDSGAEYNQFVGMLYRAMKFYLFMIDLDESGIQNYHEIATLLKMNPWQVKNEYSKISLLKTHKKYIQDFYTGLISLDAGIKTGRYPDTYFRLGIKKLINSSGN